MTVVAESWPQSFKRLQLVAWFYTRTVARGDEIVAYMDGVPRRPWYVRIARGLAGKRVDRSRG